MWGPHFVLGSNNLAFHGPLSASRPWEGGEGMKLGELLPLGHNGGGP